MCNVCWVWEWAGVCWALFALCIPFCILVSIFLVCICGLLSPWYNHSGWLGVKHQVTYLWIIVFIPPPRNKVGGVGGAILALSCPWVGVSMCLDFVHKVSSDLLNHSTFCNQTWHYGATFCNQTWHYGAWSWAGVSCGTSGLLLLQLANKQFIL